MGSKRVLSLEAFRGIAAIVVVVYHFMLGFWPHGVAILPGTPIYILFNGNAAVAFFFVLSGAVNGRPLFRDPSAASLARGLLRRWPRLMVPALLASLFSWLLFALGLYHHQAAGALSGSKWLADFANAAHAADFSPSFLGSLVQGGATVFITQHSDYDPPLWTMHFELMGSALVLVLSYLLARLSLGKGMGLVAVAVVAVAMVPPHYGMPFIVGLGLAFLLQHRGDQVASLSDRSFALLLAGSLYLFSYDKPVGIHAWIPEPNEWFWMEVQRIGLQSLGAAGIMAVGLKWRRLAFSGRWAEWMGEMALPVFLIHVPIYCSLSAWVLLTAEPALGYQAAAGLALVACFVGTIPVSMVFARIDKAWAPLVNRGADAVMAKVWPRREGPPA